MTVAAIRDVNKNIFDKREFTRSKNLTQQCQMIFSLGVNHKINLNKDKNCQATALLEGNPIKNLIYTFSYLKRLSTYHEQDLFEDKLFLKATKELSPQQQTQLKKQLILWSYNTGASGLSTMISKTLQNQKPLKVYKSTQSFLNDIAQTALPSGNPANKRAHEIANYFTSIQTEGNALKNSARVNSCIQ